MTIKKFLFETYITCILSSRKGPTVLWIFRLEVHHPDQYIHKARQMVKNVVIFYIHVLFRHVPRTQGCSWNGILCPALWKSYVDIWAVTWDFKQCGMCDQQSLRSACTYGQSDQGLCWLLEYSTSVLEYSTSVKLLTEHHLEFLCLKGGCTGLSASRLVKMPHCWTSHVTAHFAFGVSVCPYCWLPSSVTLF